MKTRYFFCALWALTTLFFSYQPAHAVYYTIQLSNGNEIKSDKYWEDGDMVRFYVKEGVVGIPKKIIAQIVTNTGTVDLYTKEQVLSAVAEEEVVQQEGAPVKQGGQTDEEFINNIKDQIVVIESNLEALAKNKSIYAAQIEQYRQQKQKSEERIRTLSADRFVTVADNKQSIEFEQSKIKDLDDKIKDMEEKIARTDKMIEAQTRMRERLEADLARAQK
ncbi:MAG: hypothetical protein N3B18_08455 [Desulfobacterota bacterium]|nr:hypothetical protein [Thermodesulfobacteriota bacterium]